MSPCVNESAVSTAIDLRIRPYRLSDESAVVDLFIRINRELAPPNLKDEFERYIALSIQTEIGTILEYYSKRAGGFWVGEDKGTSRLVGMYGLECVTTSAVELRRMYVDSAYRRCGVARRLLSHAEQQSRMLGYSLLVLSTSELQAAAIALYKGSGYKLVREEIAKQATNKTVGSNLFRFHFEKAI